MESMSVNGKAYEIIRLLGHGKGGYSYLAGSHGQEYVVKQIHHEPCDYYHFGNKIEAEKYAYERLSKTGILMPELLAVDEEKERILKEYIDGPTIYELVLTGRMKDKFIIQAREMSGRVYEAGLNIDYFPTNFVVRDEKIYYVDYECNNYMEEWSFENWGIKYWSGTEEFWEYVKKQSG
ncbi:MAG: hypothetical protein K2O16_11870 [Lachnospiraceae bacterium]|nr:hypothetical protein [Lachnospiraceae bacterium]